MASKKELENEIEELKAKLEKLEKLEKPRGLAEAVKIKPAPQTEIMFSVEKVSLTEIKIEKCTLVRGVVFERVFVAKDITMIAKSKLWKSIYELTQGRSTDEESNINHQEQNSGENNNPDIAGTEKQANIREGSEEIGNASRHNEPRGSTRATENNSESTSNGNVGGSGSGKHSQSPISDRINGERDISPVI